MLVFEKIRIPFYHLFPVIAVHIRLIDVYTHKSKHLLKKKSIYPCHHLLDAISEHVMIATDMHSLFPYIYFFRLCFIELYEVTSASFCLLVSNIVALQAFAIIEKDKNFKRTFYERTQKEIQKRKKKCAERWEITGGRGVRKPYISWAIPSPRHLECCSFLLSQHCRIS